MKYVEIYDENGIEICVVGLCCFLSFAGESSNFFNAREYKFFLSGNDEDANEAYQNRNVSGVFEKHFHEDVTVVMNIKKQVMAEVREPETLVMNKKDLLDRAKKVQENGGPESAETKVLNAEISEDGRKAKVKISLIGKFSLQNPMPNGMQEIPLNQTMTCDDDLLLSPQNIIQVLSSVCALNSVVGAEVKGTP